jgi:hypothetical protein
VSAPSGCVSVLVEWASAPARGWQRQHLQC